MNAPAGKELRDQIDAALATATAWGHARTLLTRLWHGSSDASTAAFVASRSEKLRGHVPMTSCRLAVLRSFTVEPLVPMLRACAFTGGIDAEVRLGEFNAYAQEILDPASWLYAFGPTVAILAVQTRDIAPALWSGSADLDPGAAGRAVERTVSEFRQWIRTFRERSSAALIVHSLEVPASPAQGVLDSQHSAPGGQAEAVRAINRALIEIAGGFNDVYVLDYDALVSRHGKLAWHDERKWLTVRLPISAGCLVHLAREWARFLHPVCGRTLKCLVVDLDNTLWGGVIGEDGMAGIRLDTEYPGAAFRDLQRAILDLYQRGVILAVASKNNPADAMEAIEKHPGMLLRASHFAALRINWQDKAQSLRAIADELSIGIDSLCFLDDNPVERQWVLEQCPEVTVVDLPADPMGFAAALRAVPGFERLSLSAEDKVRGRFYAEDRMRAELKETAQTLPDFYRSLAMTAEIGAVGPDNLARIAQLTQKTNQFNLTTRRYSEQQVADMAASPEWIVRWMRVTDRFGDNGIIAVALLRTAGNGLAKGACEIDTLLMSCRVIGRTVETAFLSYLADEARQAGCTKLIGRFIPTKKNPPAKDFLPSHRFARVSENDKESVWELTLPAPALAWPEYIERRILAEPARPPQGARA